MSPKAKMTETDFILVGFCLMTFCLERVIGKILMMIQRRSDRDYETLVGTRTNEHRKGKVRIIIYGHVRCGRVVWGHPDPELGTIIFWESKYLRNGRRPSPPSVIVYGDAFCWSNEHSEPRLEG